MTSIDPSALPEKLKKYGGSWEVTVIHKGSPEHHKCVLVIGAAGDKIGVSFSYKSENVVELFDSDSFEITDADNLRMHRDVPSGQYRQGKTFMTELHLGKGAVLETSRWAHNNTKLDGDYYLIDRRY